MAGAIAAMVSFTQGRLLWFLLGCYALGAVVPRPGAFLRNVVIGEVHIGREVLAVSPLVLMLAFLLFSAGLGMRFAQLRDLARNPAVLLSGLVTNALLPAGYTWVVAFLMRDWASSEQAESLLVGLALVAAMPIAGASTAWTQTVDGDLALSLGLVVASTLLSPWVTPWLLQWLASTVTGDYAEDLREVAETGTQTFLAFAVVGPSLCGIAVRVLLQERMKYVLLAAKALNLLALMALNYANAALALPPLLRSPDLPFLGVVLLVVTVLCAVAFSAGYAISRVFRGNRGNAAALMFGLGMNNNGTGLVLASTSLVEHPAVLVPILLYNLVQQIGAGIARSFIGNDGTGHTAA